MNAVLLGFLTCSMVFSMVSNSAIADIDTDLTVLYKIANEHLENGELHEAISIYDKILITSPENTEILLMKGIALSNLDRHKQSMKEFYKVLEKEPQ